MDEWGAMTNDNDGRVVVIGCENLKTKCQTNKILTNEKTENISME